MIAHAEELGGDATKAAVAGESAGGNMAINVTIRARDEGFAMPIHQVLIYPVAGRDMTRPSYVENMQAHPLNMAMMNWFIRHTFTDRAQVDDPRINLCERHDLGGLPPTTMVMAEIDPLMSEGEALARALHDADVWVDAMTYDGAAHEFFGMAAIVNKAMFAQAQVARNLTEAFAAAGRKIELD
jgi:acetyl esterase/lipase